MPEFVLTILNLLGRSGSWIWANKVDLQISKILHEALSDPEFKQRRLETLLHETAIFDEEPNELRRVLITIGASVTRHGL